MRSVDYFANSDKTFKRFGNLKDARTIPCAIQTETDIIVFGGTNFSGSVETVEIHPHKGGGYEFTYIQFKN